MLEVRGVTVGFDGFTVLDGLDLTITRGELRFLIGPNGAGKTTLLDIITGRTRPASGTVVFDAAAKTGSVDITIDMKTVNTGFADFNGHIQGEDFLDTAKFPTATFKSTRVVFDGDKPKSIEGVLTIKGVSKPVTLTVTSFAALQHPMAKKQALGANAFTVIKRSEFNAGKYVPLVSDEVRIDISIEAIAP
ncbi:MAG: ATP-binding cassette domain-containing protein [Proteobacteria bacterium]|nr:ATP-binding cassette domain-containing protein [Pseudomonadota bacterium]